MHIYIYIYIHIYIYIYVYIGAEPRGQVAAGLRGAKATFLILF